MMCPAGSSPAWPAPRFRTARSGLSRHGLARYRALAAAPALLVLPLLAGLSGSAASPRAGEPGPQAVPTVNWALAGAGHRHLHGAG